MKKALNAHSVTSVQDEGWRGIENGHLIALIDGIFDVFITADKNLRYQQNLVHRKIAIIELPFNARSLVTPLTSKIIEAVETAEQNDYIEIKPNNK